MNKETADASAVATFSHETSLTIMAMAPDPVAASRIVEMVDSALPMQKYQSACFS